MSSSVELKVRSIISLLQVSLGIAVLLTGLILYLTPSGRFSDHILLLSRSTWRYWHQIFGFSLAGSSLVHIYFNFRALKVLTRRLLS
ncbi:MAG: DUF4405 domain-containing protein [Candidatus Korarchaeum sp.]